MSGHSIPGTIGHWSQPVVIRTWHCPHIYMIMGGKAYLMVHCTISILASTYGVPAQSANVAKILEKLQAQNSDLGKVCTLERRSENGAHCFYEPECGPKCLEFDVEVGVISLIYNLITNALLLFRNVNECPKRPVEIFHSKIVQLSLCPNVRLCTILFTRTSAEPTMWRNVTRS